MVDELAADVSDAFRNFLRAAPHEWSAEIMAELRRSLPRGIIDSLAMVGTTGQIVERLKRLEAAGIEEAIIWPFPKDGQTTEDFMAKLATEVLPRVAPVG